jgi:ATP-dependent DNA helicase RecQ
MKDKIHSILLRHWGYSSFRPLQEEVILSVLSGKDTLALFPTGGGKSITYQVPGLAMDGLCLVVSPLIALMLDQVEQLKKRNLSAVALHSGLSQLESKEILAETIRGKYKFLYISPERLTLPFFREKLSQLNIALIAVDEAHCISQWGYDFRPAYLRIGEVRSFLPHVPIVAVTGSATEQVVKDIIEKLGFRDHNIIRQSFYRPNLFYNVVYEENKAQRLLQLLREQPGSALVYVRDRKKTQQWAQFLRSNGILADFYHAGLAWEERQHKQRQWIDERVRVMVATNAFGMGIDKSNVRLIVHLDLPDSIESYFQEAGRAGRDGKDAFAWLLWNQNDLDALHQQFQTMFPPFEQITRVYDALGEYFNLLPGSGENASFAFDLAQFAEKYSFPLRETFYAIKYLHQSGLISLSDTFYQSSRLKIKVENVQLYKFQVEEPTLSPFVDVLIRTYTGLFDHFTKIDENRLAKQMKTTKDIVVKGLMLLHKKGIVAYEPAVDGAVLTFTTSRKFPNELLAFLPSYENWKMIQLDRLKAVEHYVTNMSKCRSQFLLTYFGEQNSRRCGHCDVCEGRASLQMSDVEFDEIIRQLKPFLQEERTPFEIFIQFPAMRTPRVVAALRWLLDHGKIEETPQGKLLWKKKI